MKNSNDTFNKNKIIQIIAIVVSILFFILHGKENKKESNTTTSTTAYQPTYETNTNNNSSTSNNTWPIDKNDLYSLSFKDSNYYELSILRSKLAKSELEYCSHVFKDESSNTIFTWNLKSNDKEVYRCTYSYDKNRTYGDNAVVSCKVSDAYDNYLNGDKELIRDYIMPSANDNIDMFVYPSRSAYYDKYFILGKYSDMYCYVSGDDIYFDYYWYQNTDNGPVLVYKSSAKNYKTTYGGRFNDELWNLFEKSYKNIDIIPYNEYPRDKDYYEVYKEWEKDHSNRLAEKNLQEKIDLYCSCQDEEDLYYTYKIEFDYSYDDAEDFWFEYCVD